MKSHTRKPSLNVLALDRRDLPAGISFTASTGTLLIEGTDYRDAASLQMVDGRVQARLTSFPPGASAVTTKYTVPAGVNIQRVVFDGRGGNDRFSNSTWIASAAYGGLGHDILIGGFGNDSLYGGAGRDSLYGQSGTDTLFGGADSDYLSGGLGNDKLYGDTGRDSLFGGIGNDYLAGGQDGVPDVLFGGPGGDTFKYEAQMVIDPASGLPITVNRDKPKDFSLGDVIDF